MTARQPWVSQIRNARNVAEQIVVLKALKNELIGHPMKKENAVSSGVLDPLVRLSLNRNVSRNDGKSHDYCFTSRPLSEDEVARLQGLQVIASIALGGPSFLTSLHSSSVLPTILSNLCPTSNPSQLVLASIRALSNIADSCALASPNSPLNTINLAEALFSRHHLISLCRILSQSSSSNSVQSQIALSASLISRVCVEERHQQSLASSGVLDALATKLASFIVAEGLVIPGAESVARREGLQEHFPLPAPSNARLFVILEAIAVIIADSKYRASQFLYSHSILAILPAIPSTDFVTNQHTRAAWNTFNNATLNPRPSQLNAVDFLLPSIPPHQVKGVNVQAANFPPLGSSGSRDNLAFHGRRLAGTLPQWPDSSPPGLDIGNDIPAVGSEDPESPLIAYLIYLLRSRHSIERLMAASVLTVLYRAGLTNKNRETAIGLLVVPLLVQMLEDIVPPPKSKDSFSDTEATVFDWTVKERAPAVLAMLITDSEYLQKAAFDAGVVSKLSKMLKVSYDPVPDASPHAWSPHNWEISGEMDIMHSSLLNIQGQSPLLAHKIKIRESTLKAVAALVPFKDEYRKAIVEQGIIPYIVESMSPNPGKPTPKAGDTTERNTKRPTDEEPSQGYGINPVNVLIAACGAIRALSRSVSILRTTLIDNGVAIPVFKLLKHPEIEVQIASTATVCNLVTDISPMRHIITEAGVLKILCEHARSTNAKLRLNAVWALKHFVHAVSNDMKRLCLEELGQGWLVQLICDDTEDDALGTSKGKGTKVSTSIVDGEIDEDVEMDQFEESDTALGVFPCRSTSRPSSSRSKSIQQADARLAILRDAETNPAKKARKDDIAVQEQGLDFIRNLIGGAGQGGTPETTEMIDFLFNALGQDRVFEILASKLRSKVVNPFNRRGTSGSETKVIPPQSEIIKAVGYILVHMAASVPRHRQIVIAQSELLKLLVPQFNHPNVDVRLALCWLVTNLTWVDDASDGAACAQRANELKKIGILSKLEMLEHDPELNVRERAKSALWQMKQGY